jgi:hypothetical protein
MNRCAHLKRLIEKRGPRELRHLPPISAEENAVSGKRISYALGACAVTMPIRGPSPK